jgi:Fur family transcriptional regulator, iron response regulator
MQETSGFSGVKQAIAARLDANGITPTAQRVEIAALLLASMQHLSAEQVREKVRQTGSVISKATIYNTLGLLVERGLVRQVVVESTQVFYDSNVAPHYHFYNVDDGTLCDLDPAELPVDDLPEPPTGTYTEGIDIVIRVRHRGEG